MDLELTDEQTLLSESLTTLLEREWPGAEAAHEADADDARAAVGGARGLRRARGRPRRGPRRGRAVPGGARVRRRIWRRRRSSAARRCATPPSRSAGDLPAAFGELGDDARGDRAAGARPRLGAGRRRDRVRTGRARRTQGGRRARRRGRPLRGRGIGGRRAGAGARRPPPRPSVDVEPQPSLDPSVAAPRGDVRRRRRPTARSTARSRHALLARLTAVGALLAAAESVGAASRMLDDARAYAAQRRQFGRTIGSYQALRHLLADMYVRQASGWSTVLYAAAALDDDLPDADADRGGREGVRGARARARSRTARCRCSAASRSRRSTRLTASCAGSSCASSSSATRRTTSAQLGRMLAARADAAARR